MRGMLSGDLWCCRMSEADEEQEDSSEDEGNVRAKPLVAVAGPLGPGAGQEASPGTGLHLLLGLARSAPAAEVQLSFHFISLVWWHLDMAG